MFAIMGYGFYKYGVGVREKKYENPPLSPPPLNSSIAPHGGQETAFFCMAAADLRTVNSELAREKMWARIHLIPMLQAEEDRDMVRRYLADQAREKELLGTSTSPYHSDRYAEYFFFF